jgi:NAD(P)-dependent dehydrogenase (short-subunit alcohol dehydrogenase family)
LKDLESLGREKIVAISLDLLETEAIDNLLSILHEKGIQPDALINNARNIDFLHIQQDGLIGRYNFVHELILDIVIPYEITMRLANAPESNLSSVVNISSQYGCVASNLGLYDDPTQQAPLHYGVAKAGLNHLTKELAVRLAERNIRVNCVAFGGVEGRVDESFRERYRALCPQKRMLTETDLAHPVEMLLSDSASAITGHVLVADGGWCLW